MTRKMFPQFPSVQAPADDVPLRELFQIYGGWLVLLDPSKKLPNEMASALQHLGYSVDELEAARAFPGQDERQNLILRSASLRRAMRGDGDLRLQTAQYENLLPKLSTMDVSEAEIEYAIKNMLPFFDEWQS
jgi:hypothetical protein